MPEFYIREHDNGVSVTGYVMVLPLCECGKWLAAQKRLLETCTVAQ